MRNFIHVGRCFFRPLIYLFFDGYVVFYALSWIIIRYTRHIDQPIPYLNNWLTDFVFIPLVLHATQLLAFAVLGIQVQIRYRLLHMLLFAAYVSLFFEYLAPKFTTYNTADGLDVVAYFLGAFFYRYVHQPFLIKQIKSKNNLFLK